MDKLPLSFEHDPLGDAVFEVRLDEPVPIADILTGILFNAFETKPKIFRLPCGNLSQKARAEDLNLRYVPIQRLDFEECTIGLGDESIVIGCKLPYSQWPSFKKMILRVIKLIAEADFVEKINRYSVKYVNLIEGSTAADQIKKINLDIRIGLHQVTNEHINTQVHCVEDDTTHILSVKSGVNYKLPFGGTKRGIAVGVDSIRNINPSEFSIFADGLSPKLDNLVQSNRVWFFKCLKQDTINEMKPTYV